MPNRNRQHPGHQSEGARLGDQNVSRKRASRPLVPLCHALSGGFSLRGTLSSAAVEAGSVELYCLEQRGRRLWGEMETMPTLRLSQEGVLLSIGVFIVGRR